MVYRRWLEPLTHLDKSWDMDEVGHAGTIPITQLNDRLCVRKMDGPCYRVSALHPPLHLYLSIVSQSLSVVSVECLEHM